MNNQKSTEHFREDYTLEKEHLENVAQENTENTSVGVIERAEVEKDHHVTDFVQEVTESPAVAEIERDDLDGTKYSKSVSRSISISTSDSDSDDNDDDDEGGDETGIRSSASNKIHGRNKEEVIEESKAEKTLEGSNECKEASTLENSTEVSRKGSANTNDGLDKSKKKKKILKKLKIQMYLNKSYNRVSNAIMKTSKSILKSNTTNDHKSEKKGSQKSVELLNTLNSDELLQDTEDSRLSDEELTSINKYFDTKLNVIESNKEALNTINVCLQNNDSERLLNEVNDLLNERKLLIKALNHFLNQNTDYKISLEKYKDAVDILTAEKEQLSENAKTLKSCIDTLHDNEKINNTIITDNDRMADQMFTELTSKVEG